MGFVRGGLGAIPFTWCLTVIVLQQMVNKRLDNLRSNILTSSYVTLSGFLPPMEISMKHRVRSGLICLVSQTPLSGFVDRGTDELEQLPVQPLLCLMSISKGRFVTVR